MNKDILHSALENPQVLDQLTMQDLERITQEFPYFTTAHLLLLKKYQLSNDHRYSDQLHTAAAHSSDRKVLYRYVKKSSGAEEIPAPEEVLLRPELQPSTIADISVAEEGILEPIIQTEFLPVPTVQETGSKPELTVHANELDDLQREILVEAVSSSIKKEVAEDIQTETSNLDASDVDTIDPTDIPQDDFTAWIFRRSHQLHYFEQDSEAPSGQAPEGIGDWLRSEPMAQVDKGQISEELPPDETKNVKEHQRNLIDRFIRHQPKITPGKADDYLTGNIARTSVEEDLSIVSETIADLYVQQGKIDRARKAYKKLMELYPEKSIYFAARLKNLDKNKK